LRCRNRDAFFEEAKRKTWRFGYGYGYEHFGSNKETNLAVAADKKFALAGVDTVAGERVDLELLQRVLEKSLKSAERMNTHHL